MLLFLSIAVQAQTQQGYVKTIGRPNNPGVSLGGVTVRLSGNVNAVVSNAQGNFSFPVSSQRFRFSRISKKGFELADKDFLHYDFGYSPNAPITLAMVSKEELQREHDAIEEQTRNKLTLRFQEQNTLLEKKLERNLLSEAEYQKELLALHEKFDNIDTLVSTLADRYARTDYDNIDSVRMLINHCIENGELERAQQLIYSKGNIDERTKELDETRKLRLQAQAREDRLQQDLAADLYQLYEIARTQQKYDSAYVYLEKRYLTDTTQVRYLYDLVKYNFYIWAFPSEKNLREEKHKSYLLNLYGKVHNPDIAATLNTNVYEASAYMERKLGDFFHYIDDDDKAIFYYRKLLKTLQDGKTGYEYTALEAMADVYISQKKYAEAIEACQEALNYCKDKPARASVNIALAKAYYLKGDIASGLKRYMEVERTYGHPNDSNRWEIRELYVLQGFIAMNLQKQGRGKEATGFYTKAAKNAERYYNLTREMKDIESIVKLLRNLQDLWASQGKYKQMYECADRALSYAQIYLERFPSAYSRLLYAEALCQMANANANLKKTATIEQDLVECLKKSEFASIVFKERYRHLTNRIYNTFAVSYSNQGLYTKALCAADKAISILPTEVTPYRNKIEILNVMGRKEEAKVVSDKLREVEADAIQRKNESGIIFTTNPLWQYEYEYLRNN